MWTCVKGVFCAAVLILVTDLKSRGFHAQWMNVDTRRCKVLKIFFLFPFLFFFFLNLNCALCCSCLNKSFIYCIELGVAPPSRPCMYPGMHAAPAHTALRGAPAAAPAWVEPESQLCPVAGVPCSWPCAPVPGVLSESSDPTATHTCTNSLVFPCSPDVEVARF